MSRICRLARRMINENALVDARYQKISDAAFGYLMRWLLCADDHGIGPADPARILAALYPARDKPLAEIRAHHNELDCAGILATYRVRADSPRFANVLLSQVDFQVQTGEQLDDDKKSPVWQNLRAADERGKYTYPTPDQAEPLTPDLLSPLPQSAATSKVAAASSPRSQKPAPPQSAATCRKLPQTAATCGGPITNPQTASPQVAASRAFELNLTEQRTEGGNKPRARARARDPLPPREKQEEKTKEQKPKRNPTPVAQPPSAGEVIHLRRYGYNTPNDGKRDLFVGSGISDAKFGTFYRTRLGSDKRLTSPHLPMRATQALAQADLDAFAKKRRLPLTGGAVIAPSAAPPDSLQVLPSDSSAETPSTESTQSAKSTPSPPPACYAFKTRENKTLNLYVAQNRAGYFSTFEEGIKNKYGEENNFLSIPPKDTFEEEQSLLDAFARKHHLPLVTIAPNHAETPSTPPSLRSALPTPSSTLRTPHSGLPGPPSPSHAVRLSQLATARNEAADIVQTYTDRIHPEHDTSCARAILIVTSLLQSPAAKLNAFPPRAHDLRQAVSNQAAYLDRDHCPDKKRQHANTFFSNDTWRAALTLPLSRVAQPPSAGSPDPPPPPLPDNLVPADELWEKCLAQLKEEIDESNFETWLRTIKCLGINDALHLEVPSAFNRSWLMRNFKDRIEATVERQTGHQIGLDFHVGKPPPDEDETPKEGSMTCAP